MTIHNREIAEKFNTLANLLEIENANPFRIRAYRNAARIIANLAKNVSDLVMQGEELSELPGIGKDLAEKIQTLVNTGELPLLNEIAARLPSILNELMKIEGLGPKRIQILYKKLKIKNIHDLNVAIEKGRLRKLQGFGEKTEQKILQGIQHRHQYGERVKLADVFSIVTSLICYLNTIKNIEHVECAGSFRRRKETVGDLDIVVAAGDGQKIIDHFVQFDEVADIVSQGSTRSTVHLQSGIQVDLRVVPEKSYGAALLYFTGSKDHNIVIRKMAVRKKLKINEYGVFKGNKHIAGRTEKEIYEQVGLPYIEPELREDRGEIEAAQQNQLPDLITLDDIRGDLHCHTNVTAGDASLEAMVKAAEKYGYDYIAITDHSPHLNMVHKLDKKTVLKQIKTQIKTIDKINEKLKKLVILKSIEVDILEDGSLNLSDDLLKEFDLTVCSIRSTFNLPQKKQTERLLRAMDNPYFTILGHPTGRIINQRESYPVDMERIICTAKESGCMLELNAQPERLDLNDIHCKMAKDIGAKIVISTEAHNAAQFAYMEFGVFQGRRGWLEKSDVVNTRSLKELKALLRR
jgi:DNA polymerase (family X)